MCIPSWDCGLDGTSACIRADNGACGGASADNNKDTGLRKRPNGPKKYPPPLCISYAKVPN